MASLATSAPVAAEEEDAAPAGRDRWVPSFSLSSGVTWNDQSGSVSSRCSAPGGGAPVRCNPDDDQSNSELRPGGAGDDKAVTPYVGGSLQLMTPALRIPGVDVEIPGSPRLFFMGELPYQFAIVRNIASFRKPDRLTEPELAGPGAPPQEDIPEIALLGAGARTTAEIQGMAFGAGAGLAFAFEAFGREIRVKPSVGWLRYEIDVEGRVVSGRCIIQENVPPGQNARSICDVDGRQPPGTTGFTRVIDLRDQQSEWFDAVGPALEIEMDAKRLGPVGISLFLGGQYYRIISDREVSLSDSQTIGPDTLGAAVQYDADFSFEVDPVIWRANLGIRFHWLGD